MSIPPLVCSTPPPPEQCEDDKDPEDFEYNLSQEEDEENDFGCGNFTSFNQFNTGGSHCNLDEIKHESIDAVYNEVSNKHKEESQDVILNHSIEIAYEEDVNIEDLNLNINEDNTSICRKDTLEFNETVNSADTILNTVKDLHSDIPCSSNKISQTDCKISSVEENTFDVISPVEPHILSVVNEKVTNKVNVEQDKTISNLEFSVQDENTEKETNLQADEIDFEDFEEFHFANSNNKSETIINSADPWVNDNSDDVVFGDFTANFEDDNSKLSKSSSKSEIVSYAEIETNNHTENKNIANEDDDFGDFDEFKCSSTEDKENDNESKENTSSVNVVPVLNFSDNEQQLIESINKVIQSIFQEEITESEDEMSSNLESSLGVTWGYLKEIDKRQPYIVNWNNSLAQKTLLKALCIDSRNILFGPKWSSNMPKYAANLNTAPLMPQKQMSQGNFHQSEQAASSDKSTSKVSWVDPFTSDGQEFTYAEALLLDLEHLMASLDQMAHNHSTLKISDLLSTACNADGENAASESGPTDLDVFEATMSTKIDKIYSNTLHIQPMRQINLPDTHIFTPTDSEIPRSKTIHYDTTHTILMPQQVNAVKTQPDTFPSQTNNSSNSENDEYWEFQDYKASSENSNSVLNQKEEQKNKGTVINQDNQAKPNFIYETQVLQPIKLEPIMPTLNWPNPGEVKETFDDFSDFISISKAGTENALPPNIQQGVINTTEQISIKNEALEDASQKTSELVDDDFDTFQSALPSNIIFSPLEKNEVETDLSNPNVSNFETVFSKLDNVKSDNKSQFDINPNVNIKQNISNVSKEEEIKLKTFVKPIANTSILQPIPLSQVNSPSVNQTNQQNTGQILQPLSLESFSQINWPNPGIDLHDLSRFNPVESLQSLKSEASSQSKNSSPIHNQKILSNYQAPDEDIWGEFVSSIPKPPAISKKPTTFADDDEWTDFVSSPSVNPHNGLNTISLNVHTNSNIQKASNSSKYPKKNNDMQLDIPTLNYITPKTSSQKTFNDRHFQNL